MSNLRTCLLGTLVGAVGWLGAALAQTDSRQILFGGRVLSVPAAVTDEQLLLSERTLNLREVQSIDEELDRERVPELRLVRLRLLERDEKLPTFWEYPDPRGQYVYQNNKHLGIHSNGAIVMFRREAPSGLFQVYIEQQPDLAWACGILDSEAEVVFVGCSLLMEYMPGVETVFLRASFLLLRLDELDEHIARTEEYAGLLRRLARSIDVTE